MRVIPAIRAVPVDRKRRPANSRKLAKGGLPLGALAVRSSANVGSATGEFEIVEAGMDSQPVVAGDTLPPWWREARMVACATCESLGQLASVLSMIA